MELYKYCRRSHMNAMLERGSARIGTLFDWRRAGLYGELVTDQSEGYTNLKGNLIFYDWRFVSAMMVESSTKSEGEGESRLVHFTNNAMHTQNHYAFSASRSYSSEEHYRWLELEGYDSCYCIQSAELFFRSLSETPELAERADFVCQGPVHYYNESLSNNIFAGTFHPALVKKCEFGSQNEVRGLWVPKASSREIGPIILEKSLARIYVSEHRVLPT